MLSGMLSDMGKHIASTSVHKANTVNKVSWHVYVNQISISEPESRPILSMQPTSEDVFSHLAQVLDYIRTEILKLPPELQKKVELEARFGLFASELYIGVAKHLSVILS